MVSLGTDAHYEDMLAGLNLSSGGYLNIIKGLRRLAGEFCDGRFAVFLEGGYALCPLSEIIAASYGLERNRKVTLEYTDVHDTTMRGENSIREALDIQKKYWKV